MRTLLLALILLLTACDERPTLDSQRGIGADLGDTTCFHASIEGECFVVCEFGRGHGGGLAMHPSSNCDKITDSPY